MNKYRLFIISVFTFCHAAALADDATKAQWRIVESIELQRGADGIRWRATFLDENFPEKRTANIVGNVGVPENFNQRRLKIEVFDEASGALLRREEFPAPTETIQDDPCSITELTKLDVEAGYLTLDFQYQFACGAGAGTDFSYKISVTKNKSQMIEFNISSASREIVSEITIDYKKGRMTSRYGRTEEGLGKPLFKKISIGAYPLNSDALSQCPAPLRGAIPNCGQWGL